MGFVSDSDNIELNAFYTQKGRAFYLNGNDVDKKVIYFSLDDSDTNYLISSNPRINTDSENNTLDSGFVPDLSGDDTSCTKSVADGSDLKNFIFYKSGETQTNKEVRFLNTNKGDFIGVNNLTVKVDLYKYILWLNQYGSYSLDQNNSYNKNEPNLGSPFIQFYDNIGIFDYSNNTISYDQETYFSLSEKDYKNFEQLNRFLLFEQIDGNFVTITPSKNKQSSPIEFIFSTLNSLSTNYGQGLSGMLLNNRNYGFVLTNNINNEEIFIPQDELDQTLTLNDELRYEIRPCVKVSYYLNGIMQNELFKIRDQRALYNNPNVSNNNQYLKLFINSENKTLITRETELLNSFITSRNDLFYQTSSNSFYSYPITLFLNDINGNSKYGSLKIILCYDTTKTYTLTQNETFTI